MLYNWWLLEICDPDIRRHQLSSLLMLCQPCIPVSFNFFFQFSVPSASETYPRIITNSTVWPWKTFFPMLWDFVESYHTPILKALVRSENLTTGEFIQLLVFSHIINKDDWSSSVDCDMLMLWYCVLWIMCSFSKYFLYFMLIYLAAFVPEVYRL